MTTANEFVVTYANGVVAKIHSLEESVEAFCNSHFGSSWEGAKANGATVVMNAAPSEAPATAPEAPAAESQAPSVGVLDRAMNALHSAEDAISQVLHGGT